MIIHNIDFKKQLEAIRGLSADAFKNDTDIEACQVGSNMIFNNQVYRIDKINKYLDVKWANFGKRKKDYWVYELTLFCLNDASIKLIEWEIDDELEISETISSVKYNMIQYNNSKVTKSVLEFISDEEEGTVSLNGKHYHYSETDTWAGLYYADSKEPIPVRFYEFVSDSGEYLTIEVWEDDGEIEREAFLSKSIDLSNLTILNL